MSSNNNESQENITVKKRGPGRPRKHPLKPLALANENELDNSGLFFIFY